MENAHQLQCKALRGLKKSRRRENNGEDSGKQCAEQSKTAGNPGEHLRPVERRQTGDGAARESLPSGPEFCSKDCE